MLDDIKRLVVASRDEANCRGDLADWAEVVAMDSIQEGGQPEKHSLG
jgi:hypothetical protein